MLKCPACEDAIEYLMSPVCVHTQHWGKQPGVVSYHISPNVQVPTYTTFTALWRSLPPYKDQQLRQSMEVKEGEAMAEKCIIVFSSVVFQTCACLHVLTVALYICEGPVPLSPTRWLFQKILLCSHGNALPLQLFSLCNGSSYSAHPICSCLGLRLLSHFN